MSACHNDMRQQMDADREEYLDILGNGDQVHLVHTPPLLLQLRDHNLVSAATKDETESFSYVRSKMSFAQVYWTFYLNHHLLSWSTKPKPCCYKLLLQFWLGSQSFCSLSEAELTPFTSGEGLNDRYLGKIPCYQLEVKHAFQSAMGHVSQMVWYLQSPLLSLWWNYYFA